MSRITTITLILAALGTPSILYGSLRCDGADELEG